MKVTGNSFFFLFFFFPLVLGSRRISSPTVTLTSSTLDVSVAMRKTTQVLTFDSKGFQQSLLHEEDNVKAKDSSEFQLKLHSRDFIRRPTHKDYRSLTMSRLRRDSVRVEALNTRLNLALHDVSRSDLKPLEEQNTVINTESQGNGGGGGMQGPVISGTSQGSGEYFSRVSVGQPPKSMYMVLDTGSDITWIQCQPCTDCYQQADPIFDPTASSSYSSLGCYSSQCRSLDVSACQNSSCLYQVSYGDGSYTVGNFGTETVTFGDSGSSVKNVAFGCGHDNEGLFVGAAGLLGLGGGPLSFPSQLSATDFSYCLVDRDSTSTSTIDFSRKSDDVSSAASSTNSVTAPLLRNKKLETFYYVGITGMSVGGRMLSIPTSSFEMDESGKGGVIIDSGTAVTRLHPDVYSALRDAFKSGTTGLQSTNGVALFDTCYDLSSKTSIEVPTVAFHFPEERVLRLPAKNYVIPVDSSGTFCLAFAPTSSSTGLSIIGNVQQQGTRVSFDLANGRVGFASEEC